MVHFKFQGREIVFTVVTSEFILFDFAINMVQNWVVKVKRADWENWKAFLDVDGAVFFGKTTT